MLVSLGLLQQLSFGISNHCARYFFETALSYLFPVLSYNLSEFAKLSLKVLLKIFETRTNQQKLILLKLETVHLLAKTERKTLGLSLILT